MATIPIILDCDPGHDDALAIVLALARPELGIRAITTVAGNAPLDRTTRNALRVLTLVGRTDVPVAAGAERPLVREPWVPVEFHGDSGLDGADLPEPAVGPAGLSAVELMAAVLRETEEPVTLVATGPLTNVALLLRAAPALRARIAGISLMGGSLGAGNTTASAEFNIWADPEAAAIVFESGIPIRMSGLDVTHQALLDRSSSEALRATGTGSARIAAELTDYALDRNMEWGGRTTAAIHDAVAVGHLAIPDLVDVAAYHVAVDTTDGPARGRTVCDGLPYRLRRDGRTPNAEVGIRIDRGRFESVLLDSFGSLP